jgi:hypothetical protein
VFHFAILFDTCVDLLPKVFACDQELCPPRGRDLDIVFEGDILTLELRVVILEGFKLAILAMNLRLKIG